MTTGSGTQAKAISKAAGAMAGGVNQRELLADARLSRYVKVIQDKCEIKANGRFLRFFRDGKLGAVVDLTGRADVVNRFPDVPAAAFTQAARQWQATRGQEAAEKPARGGQPLAERAGAATVLGLNAYAFEFTATSGEDVYGCYDSAAGEQKYALETVAGIVTHCNCPDRAHRRRVCKHMVELAVVLQTGLRTPGGSVVMAASALSVLQGGPRTVADSLRALRVDYHAEAARAVILTAAAVSRAAGMA